MGLLGAKAYCETHKDELKSHKLCINVDMTGVVLGKDIACCSSEESLVSYINYLGKEVGFNIDMASRHLNEGFSGGEKKRNEILQMKLLKPSLALIDEIDSGLDVDGLEMVANAINSMLDGKFSCLIISHYSKLYKMIKPTHVHIIIDGRVITSGDSSLIERVDKEGYKWLEKEFGVNINKETTKRVMLGTCNVKESVNNG